VGGAVWVLASALGAVSEAVVVDGVGVDVCAVATAVDGSGCEMRGCGACRGAVGQSGSVCCCF
jgi:hypothetical protein